MPLNRHPSRSEPVKVHGRNIGDVQDLGMIGATNPRFRACVIELLSRKNKIRAVNDWPTKEMAERQLLAHYLDRFIAMT